MNSGFRGALEGDRTKVKALGLAVAVQLMLLPAIFGWGWARPASLPLVPLAAVAGGVLFGLSMRWAAGCAAGVWYKLGAGDLGALLAVLGMALGATAADTGPLSPLRALLQAPMASQGAASVPPLVPAVAGILLLGLSARWTVSRAGAWTWRKTGLWVGITAALAWPVSAAAGRDFGLAVVPEPRACSPASEGIPCRGGTGCSCSASCSAAGSARAAADPSPSPPRGPPRC
jgi:uncharacterized membrane protein YedE/YeeE